MPLYEHVFIARQDLAQAQVDALAENATKIIEDNGGKVAKTETWGLRSLAYRIQKNRKAHYVMLDIDAPAPAIAELERQTQINEDVIRYMTIRVDEHEQGPSAMMRRNDRDRERGDRGDRGDRPGRQGGRRFGPEQGMTRIYLDVGRDDNVRPADIVGAIANEANVPGRAVGAIDLYERFSFVEVPENLAERVIRALKRTTIRGRKLSPTVARPQR